MKPPDRSFRILSAIALFTAFAYLVLWLTLLAGARAAHAAPASGDNLPRQTAHAWTGSPAEFDYPDREQKLRLPRVFEVMKIGRGDAVADIGAGGGWLTVRLARQVGPSGVVYAEDILPKFTNYIAERAQKENLANVRTILGTTTDPKLPPNTLDAAIILNAYHEFERPLTMLRHIYRALKPGGRLGFIERDTEELRSEARRAYESTGQIKRRVDEKTDDNPYTDDHRLALPIVEREAALAGFSRVQSLELNDDNYLLVVTRK
jgi:SAM-dependent methyltransferase